MQEGTNPAYNFPPEVPYDSTTYVTTTAPQLASTEYAIGPMYQEKIMQQPVMQTINTTPTVTTMQIVPATQIQVVQTDDVRSMLQIGLALAIISWILQILNLGIFALICIIAAQIVLWNTYMSYRDSVDMSKRNDAQQCRKLAIIHLSVCLALLLIPILIVSIIVIVLIVYFACIAAAVSVTNPPVIT